MSIQTLTDVNLSHNLISELPECLRLWNHIQKLNVSHNQIAEISECLWPLFYHVEIIVWVSGSLNYREEFRMSAEEFFEEYGPHPSNPMYFTDEEHSSRVASTRGWVWPRQFIRKAWDWHYLDTKQRIDLSGNPFAERYTESKLELADLVRKWRHLDELKSCESQRLKEEGQVSDGEDLDHRGERRASRENSRRARREQRLKSVAHTLNRDRKFGV